MTGASSSHFSGRPVLIYDGDCGICTKLAGFVARRLRPSAEVRPAQQLDLAIYGLTEADCEEALQFVAADGRVFAAQDAVARLLLDSRPLARPLGPPLLLPGINQLAGLVYRWVARNRHRLPGGTPACSLPAAERSPGSGGGAR